MRGPRLLAGALAALLHPLLSGGLPAGQVEGQPPPRASGLERIERRPEGGLAYRVTMSTEATPERPDRLVVWLHPSGVLFNEHVEALAPDLAGHGFALMVMLDKDPRGWTYDDAKMLLGTSLPDAGTIPGIELRRPVLMGFSAGGQVAIELWGAKPGLYGGIVVDAAYPAESVEGGDAVFGPPSDPAVPGVPFIAFVGGEDPLLWVWEKVEQPWKEAGVPLTVIVVPGKAHEWLFGEDQVKDLLAWLDRIPAVGNERRSTPPPRPGEPDPPPRP